IGKGLKIAPVIVAVLGSVTVRLGDSCKTVERTGIGVTGRVSKGISGTNQIAVHVITEGISLSGGVRHLDEVEAIVVGKVGDMMQGIFDGDEQPAMIERILGRDPYGVLGGHRTNCCKIARVLAVGVGDSLSAAVTLGVGKPTECIVSEI